MNAGVRRGFTLIELLAVSGIIALLIGILLPTGRLARRAAQRAACARQLHEIGIALANYAARHDGFLPPYGSSATDRVRNYYLSQPGEPIEDWSVLWADRQISTGRLFYCPATTAAAHRYDTPSNRWDRPRARTGYSRRYLPPVGGGDRLHVAQVGDGRALAGDLVVSPAHLDYQHQIGANVLYADGSVEFRRDLADLFAAAGVTGSGPADNDQLDAVWAGLDFGVAP